MRKIFLTSVAFMLVLSTSAHAVLPVTDVASIAQQVISYATMVSQYTTQVQQYSNQIQQLTNQFQQLKNEAQNLQNLNWQAPLSNLNNVAQIMRNAQGIANSFATSQAQFQKLYPDFTAYSNMQGPAYVSQATAWQNQNRNAAQDTMNMQAQLRDNFLADQNTLNDASSRSAAAQGTRDALQATNQLLALLTKQLMQLQQLTSTTASMDAGYAAQRASNEAAAQAQNQQRFSGWTNKGARQVIPTLGILH